MNEKVGIIQIDGRLPNLALMKICAYHERKDDLVEWWHGELWNETYDIIYASKIFSFSKLPQLPDHAKIGGTGIDYNNKLPKEIENITPSYSLYPNCNYHIGFSMKGCRLRCTFCCVPKKEGQPYHNNTVDEILINPNGGKNLMLLDNDFFGGENWKANLTRIIDLNLKVNFNQGLNIRNISTEQSELLAKVRYYNTNFNQKYLTFAWDKYHDKDRVMKGIEICNKAGIPTKNMQFFVLIGYDTSEGQDMERVSLLKELGARPFVMPYNKSDPYQKSFARWVNHRAIFNTCTWDEYKYKCLNKS